MSERTWTDIGQGLLVSAVLVPPTTALRAWVLAKCWLWLLVPLGAAPISMPHALGLSFLVMALTRQRQHGDPDDRDRSMMELSVREAFTSVAFSLMLLGTVALCRWWP